jgi:diguanylate cyclase (GGDEF)-like protein
MSERPGALTVAMVDLDHFKRVNDTCSHEVGDDVLRTVGRLLEAAVPAVEPAAGSFAARLGGEEFLLVLVDTADDAAAALLEDLRRTVAAHPWAELTGTVPVTTSIGVTSTAAFARPTPADLLGLADEHLYRAKDAGRDRVVTDRG